MCDAKVHQLYLNVERWERVFENPWEPLYEAEEKVLLRMEPLKLREIAIALNALLLVWDVLEKAQKKGHDISHITAVVPPRPMPMTDDELPWVD